MIPEELILKIVRSAAKAPSGHNTQPWKFSLNNDMITISPDFSRALPVVDPDRHALYISLGCACENAVTAAENFGLNCVVKITTESDAALIRLELTQSKFEGSHQLYSAIGRRQVSRCAYSSTQPAPQELRQLVEAISGDGVYYKLFVNEDEKKSLAPFVFEANAIAFSNRKQLDELIKWVRFSQKEAMSTGDGIYTATMGLPAMGRTIGSRIMKWFVTAKSEEKRWRKLLPYSAGFVLFMTDEHNPVGWINLGRAFQRFGLTATQLGISHAHVNMPCEVSAVRNKMISHFDLEEKTPLLLIRYGYANPMPYSFRRPLNEIIHQKK